MSLLGRQFRNADGVQVFKNWFLASGVSWNEGVHFSKKVDTPLPPKRPLTAYMLFVKDKRKDILKENPALKNTEQMKVIAEKWGKLTFDSKKDYETQARENTVIYGEEHKKYYENLSDEQKKELLKQKQDKRKARRLYRLNQALRKSGMPKPAVSAYPLFVRTLANKEKSDPHQANDFIKNIVKKWMSSSEDTQKDFIKKAAEKWRTLSDEDKKMLVKQAAADKLRYKSEMAEWAKKLLHEGNEKLLKEYSELKRGAKSLLEQSIGSDEKKVRKPKNTHSTKKE